MRKRAEVAGGWFGRGFGPVAAWLLATLVVVVGTGGAAAQQRPTEAPGAQESEGADPPEGADAPPTTAEQVGTGEIRIDVERFGVGQFVRPGEWAGVRIKFFDSAPRQREIILRIEGVDPDGDTPLYQRELTSNPGLWQAAWMYLRLPFWYRPDQPLVVSAHEALEVAEGEAGTEVSASGFRAGRLLGRALILPKTPQSVLDASTGLMGVFGPSMLGLSRYADRPPGGENWSALGHELTEISPRLAPDDMPDRWQGLSAFAVLVWGAGEPGELRGDRARALRHWVERGGHLVVVLPPAGETWTNRVSNELFDLLPAVSIVRREGVDLEPYRAMLSRKLPGEGPALPRSAVAHELRPIAEAAPSEAMPILDGPGGVCIAARRLVGTGAVTLVGLDLSQRALIDQDLISPDVFWHRVLGRRGELPSQTELKDLAAQQNMSLGSRSRVRFDADIGGEIAKTGRSAAGVLLGLGLFVLYWALAGPVGWAILKSNGRRRHSWMAYVLTSAGFTAVAWGGATLLRPGRVEGNHLSMLDHVYGQPVQRARTWASLLIPRYGSASIAVGDASTGSEDIGGADLIAAFDPPWSSETGAAMFPDTRGYVVDTRRPHAIVAPTRSTVKQIQADWLGGPRWDMPRPVFPESAGSTAGSEQPPEIRLDENRRPVGFLRHGLPGPLENVTVFVIIGQQPLGSGAGGAALTARATAYRLTEWKPGETLDLSLLSRAGTDASMSAERYLEELAGQGMTFDDVTSQMNVSSGSLSGRMTALAFFSQLAPPRFEDPSRFGGNWRGPNLAQRAATHGWDLGRWFTQPCLIVVGQMGMTRADSACPTPITIDGEPVKFRGRTVVRWVYPLPASPPRIGGAEAPEPGPVLDGGADLPAR